MKFTCRVIFFISDSYTLVRESCEVLIYALELLYALETLQVSPGKQIGNLCDTLAANKGSQRVSERFIDGYGVGTGTSSAVAGVLLAVASQTF